LHLKKEAYIKRINAAATKLATLCMVNKIELQTCENVRVNGVTFTFFRIMLNDEKYEVNCHIRKNDGRFYEYHCIDYKGQKIHMHLTLAP
jgi:hypothetical protein